MFDGERLRLFRERAEYSQEYLARKIGVTTKTYQNYENRVTAPTANTLLKLAKMLSVGLNDFYGGDE